ncbi:flavodoxin [Massilibacteroides sp.]|uniref:flavodoxin n=1 Tax=Massilibacteroides sp. TaxID=2034766 RepID=UPI00260B150A|nr:flavodoxin [Massilibacteroides sp.]MDD4514587.1 flavodoxin [Massilibacteroides sp.]
MKKTGLFYGVNTKKTALIGKEIQEAFGENKADIVAVEEAGKKSFEQYDNLIIGASTWFDGELPTYWDELLPELENLKMKGKKVAIFGLGDQEGYPENFVDGIGLLAEFFEASGAEIVGHTSIEGYTFEGSRALRDGKFLGLAIDQENQSDLTGSRIAAWVKQLKKEFN